MQERLFEPFASSADSAPDGIGLGLMVARGLAEAMGGQLSVASARDGTGTLATVLLRSAGGR